jgi:cation diffusion facilitator family transporter
MLWAAMRKLESPETVATVHVAALWVAGGALVAKELLFRYMLRTAKRIKSSMLVANAWHARSDAASSLVVGIGIIGNLAGYPILDPIAALIVGFMVGKMGWGFGWDALHDLMDRAVDEQEVAAIRQTLVETPGVSAVHDVRTRKMGDMILVDAHLEVDATITVEAGHDIAVSARNRVLQRHRVLNLMTHIDPWRRPDLDHPGSVEPAHPRLEPG